MKKVILILFALSALIMAQSGKAPPNSLLPNFKPFDTPRTNCRPGTVYRLDENGVQFIVKDIKQIKGLVSNEGNLLGQMTFSREDLLQILNLNFNLQYVTAEVEIKNAEREYTEQLNVDQVLWEDEQAAEIITDNESRYYIIRETISSKEITFRFNNVAAAMLLTGKSSLKKKESKADEIIDFPYSVTKKFKEPKRLFFLDEKISSED
jgi:hypothetical protein